MIVIDERGAGAVIGRRLGDAGAAELAGIDGDLERQATTGAERTGEKFQLGEIGRLKRAGAGDLAVG